MSKKINTYVIDDIVFIRNHQWYLGFITGLGYNPNNMMRESFSSAGYTDRTHVKQEWKKPEDWEAVLNTLPLVQI
jgi:hypothetical protein